MYDTVAVVVGLVLVIHQRPFSWRKMFSRTKNSEIERNYNAVFEIIINTFSRSFADEKNGSEKIQCVTT